MKQDTSGLGNADVETSDVILVSAPGAVGKSTLARQISYSTGAMLLDLAIADPVGANTLVGGLARTNLYQLFQQGDASLVIDGLDEAQMRVTHGSFVAFLNDVVQLTSSNRKPIVLFGRTRAVEDTWLELMGKGIDAPVLEIEYYEPHLAVEFAKIYAQNIRRESIRREPDGRAIELILDQLRSDLQDNNDCFSGYAPVLIAVAKQIADPDNPDNQNTQALISRIEQGKETVTLTAICDSILVREQEKLRPLPFQDTTLHKRLYTPEEQISRLIGHLYGGNMTSSLPTMSPQDQQIYVDALKSWMLIHPFLDGSGNDPSSAVFGGLLAAKALHTGLVSDKAFHGAVNRSTAANPFLSEFYILELSEGNLPAVINPAHVGLLYASLCARLSQGESASLRIDGEISGEEAEDGLAEIEILRRTSNGDDLTPLRFSTTHVGQLIFGSIMQNVDINFPEGQVSVGDDVREITFIAPVSIEAATIVMEGNHILIQSSPKSKDEDIDFGQLVSLETNSLEALRIIQPPTLRGVAQFVAVGRDFEGNYSVDFIVNAFGGRTDGGCFLAPGGVVLGVVGDAAVV